MIEMDEYFEIVYHYSQDGHSKERSKIPVCKNNFENWLLWNALENSKNVSSVKVYYKNKGYTLAEYRQYVSDKIEKEPLTPDFITQ